jgi:hypothetical protein
VVGREKQARQVVQDQLECWLKIILWPQFAAAFDNFRRTKWRLS